MEDKKLQEAFETIIEIFSKNTKEEIVSISSIQFVIKGNAGNLKQKDNQRSFTVKSGQPVTAFFSMSCQIIGDEIFCG